MTPPPEPRSGGYLRRVLADGARAPQSRSGTHALLGASVDAARVDRATGLAPPTFSYAQAGTGLPDGDPMADASSMSVMPEPIRRSVDASRASVYADSESPYFSVPENIPAAEHRPVSTTPRIDPIAARAHMHSDTTPKPGRAAVSTIEFGLVPSLRPTPAAGIDLADVPEPIAPAAHRSMSPNVPTDSAPAPVVLPVAPVTRSVAANTDDDNELDIESMPPALRALLPMLGRLRRASPEQSPDADVVPAPATPVMSDTAPRMAPIRTTNPNRAAPTQTPAPSSLPRQQKAAAAAAMPLSRLESPAPLAHGMRSAAPPARRLPEAVPLRKTVQAMVSQALAEQRDAAAPEPAPRVERRVERVITTRVVQRAAGVRAFWERAFWERRYLGRPHMRPTR